MSARRLAARLAVRSMRAAPGRSALIAAMIALPVAGAVMGGLVQAGRTPTTAELVATALGHAQAKLQVVSTPDTSIVQDPADPAMWTNGAHGRTAAQYRTPASAVAAGTRIVPVYDANVTAKTAGGVGSMQAVVGEVWDPAFAGRWDVVSGSGPSDDGQVMVTRAALTRLGVKIGESLELLQPAARSVTVSGVIDDRTTASSTAEIFGTTAALGTVSPGLQQTSYYLPDTPVSWAGVQRLNRLGITALSRGVALDPPPVPAELAVQHTIQWSWVALISIAVAFVLFEIVLLAGAAFAVTARQQQRWLAVVASVGSDRRTLVRIVTGSGVAIGLLGGVTGVAVGLAAGSIAMVVSSDGSAVQFYGWHFPVAATVIAVVVAVFAGWLSALLPARAAAKADVLAALRGARAPAVSRRRVPILGLVVVALGAALTLWGGALVASGVFDKVGDSPKSLAIGLLVAGPILMQVGALLAVRLVLSAVARIAGPLGVGVRLASRDLVRNRGRSVPAVAAIMATVFVGIFVMCLTGAISVQDAKQYRWTAQPGQVTAPLRYWTNENGDGSNADAVTAPGQAIAAARSVLGTGDVRVLNGVPDPAGTFTKDQLRAKTLYPTLGLTCGTCKNADNFVQTSGGQTAHLFVGSASDIQAVIGHPISASSTAVLAAGGAVVLDRNYIGHDRMTIDWWSAEQMSNGDNFAVFMDSRSKPTPIRTDTLAAAAEPSPHTFWYGAFISPETAKRLGFVTLPTYLLATPRTIPTQAQQDELNQKLGVLQNSPRGVQLTVERGPQDATLQVGWIAALACAVIVIAASAAAVGLSRIDNRPDADTLAAIGAPPAVQRRTAFWLALVVGGTGTMIGGGLALIPALALGLPGSSLSFAPPWPPILVLAVGVPVLIAAVSWAIRPSRRQLSRRTAIA